MEQTFQEKPLQIFITIIYEPKDNPHAMAETLPTLIFIKHGLELLERI